MAQNHTISGFVEDARNGEKMIGANIYDPAALKGTTTNTYGFYSLTLPEGEYTLVTTYVGYQSVVSTIDLIDDTVMNISMSGAIDLEAVEVIASQTEKIQEESQMSAIEIPIATIEKIPTLLGEKDVLKALQLLPGVQSGSEGSSGMYVRGGGPDQNLILLDGVPVYNASHLFGFFSVFNTDAINSVELIKGGFPAHYGGRLSSVVDIRMKEGNMKEFHGSGSVGIIASKLTLEGPIVKDKASFIVSGRRTYIDVLTRPLIKNQFKRDGVDGVAGYYFYDLNGKVNWKISEKDRIYLSSYLGDDRFYFDIAENYELSPTQQVSDKIGARLGWGNITTALRYNRVINQKLFANLTATYSRYNFNVGQSSETFAEPADPAIASDFAFDYESGIYDWSGRLDFDFIPSPNHAIKFGAGDIYHTFVPGVTVFNAALGGNNAIDTTFGAKPIFAHEYFLYAEDDFKIGARFKVNLGLHFSGFLTSSDHYYSLQPRASGRFLINEHLSLKASYAEMQQYIHLLTNGTIGLPTDLWVPSTSTVKPEDSRQVAIGLAQTLFDKYEISVEGYYKTMSNLIEYRDGASFFSGGGDWESQIEFGDGVSYGVELFFQKKVGKTAGWIGYTLSWTNRQFDNLNFGEPFPYRYDRRHDLSFVLTQDVTERIDFALTWVYGTGNAVSLPIVRYAAPESQLGDFFGGEIEYYESRNGFRMAAYHRLDFGLNFHKEKKFWKRTWSIGAYNAYSRKNPFFLYFEDAFELDPSGTPISNRNLVQVSLFPIIPYVSYSFSF
ncbi:MAG: TonB-dependent receptor [Salibacteraceae bacterium]